MRLLEEMKELTQLRGISGCEDEVREYLIKKIEGHCDSYKVDNMGNLIVHKKGKKAGEKRVLFSAHMDEVGFIITHITAEGMLHFETVGGVTPAVTAGRPVLVGKKAIPGVIGTRPIHLLTEEERKDYAKVEDMRIDIGAKDKKEAEEMVSLGDMATFIGPWKELGENTILARAIDDRAGCALLLEMLRGELEYDCTFAFVVQEETGCAGSKAVAFQERPDIAVAVESTTAGDLPTAPEGRQVCRVGAGPVISFMDKGTIYPWELYQKATGIAGEAGIPWQTKEGVFGGNDARSYASSAAGAKVLAVSLPVRYLHAANTLVNKTDIENTRKLPSCSTCPSPPCPKIWPSWRRPSWALFPLGAFQPPDLSVRQQERLAKELPQG